MYKSLNFTLQFERYFSLSLLDVVYTFVFRTFDYTTCSQDFQKFGRPRTYICVYIYINNLTHE